jgi:hypothetical protein
MVLSYDENILKAHPESEVRIPLMRESVLQLTSGIFWKCKLIHGLFILNNFNILDGRLPSDLT